RLSVISLSIAHSSVLSHYLPSAPRIVQLSVAVASPNTLGNISSSHSTVTLAGQVITGGVVSSTVIVCTQSLALPQLSTAVHVRSIVYVSGQLPGMVVSEYPTPLTAALQLSVAVASPKTLGSISSSHSTV